MGSKTEARDKMSKAGVPVVPGCEGLGDGTDALKEADRIGYPVMIKAAFGGGGKGMRVVESPGKLLSMLESAEREAKSAFGNGMVYLERYLVNPRHIEIQVLADAFGNVIHLGERECSIQRRHQKVVEESPSPVITTDIRDKMGKAACQAAKACGYINAGTVEFMYADDKFYFLEMNTRLQVEHPVTELVYGIDLVKEQFRIAYGDSISLNQGDILPRGHAIECRIYSEGENFLPEIGTLTDYVVPQGPGVRVDGGVALGSEITVHYDPMISKLLTWGEDRNIAIARMKRALKEYRISGVKTTIPFCLMVMKSESFIDGNYHTGFIEKNFMISENHDEAIIEAAAIAASIIHLDKKNNGKKIYLPKIDSVNKNNWKSSGRSENLM